jgi:hypothetical protein
MEKFPPKKWKIFPKKEISPQNRKKNFPIKIKNFPLGKTHNRWLFEKHYYFILLQFYYSKIEVMENF